MMSAWPLCRAYSSNTCQSTQRRDNGPRRSLWIVSSSERIATMPSVRAISARQVVLERGYVEQGKLTEQQLDEALDVLSMTHP